MRYVRIVLIQGLKYYVNIPATRSELSRRISYFIRSAKQKARTKHTTAINTLKESYSFLFYLKSVEPVQKTNEFVSINFESYASTSSSDCILLVREQDQLCIQPEKYVCTCVLVSHFPSGLLNSLIQ